MKVNTKYDMFQTVYLKTDQEQEGRMITRIILDPGSVIYQLTFGTSVSEHYEQEIDPSPNLVKKIS